MKKILSLLSLVTVLGISSIEVFASVNSIDPNANKSGCVEISSSLARDTVNGTTTKKVEGGTWKYGFTGTKVFSQYDHNTVLHRSSVENSNKDSLKRSDWKNPGFTAYVAIEQTLKGNKAYYATSV